MGGSRRGSSARAKARVDVGEWEEEGGAVRVLRHEWRVLRFNESTRQSVARVATVAVDVTVTGEKRDVITGGKGEGERRGVILQRQQPDCLAFEYLKSMAAVALTSCHLHHPHLSVPPAASPTASPPLRVLCLGLGGGSLPLFLAHELPSAHIDAVEIDPAVIAAARQHMGFPAWAVRPKADSRSGLETQAEAPVADQTPLVKGQGAAAAAAAEQVVWRDIFGRVAVYNEDAVSFVVRAAERIGRGGGEAQNAAGGEHGGRLNKEAGVGSGDAGDGEEQQEPYDLVLVDVFDGSDETPPELLDRDGPFLRALARVVHPKHGTLVMNVHADVPSPSLWERVTGRFGDGWADESTQRGRRIHAICRAYSSALLHPAESHNSSSLSSGIAFTTTTSSQGNMTLVVQRGVVLGGSGDRQAELEGRLKEAAAVVEEGGAVPFTVAPRVVRGLKVLPVEWRS
ncbi:unnamed protein product [Closterium sp. Yama58-4]|nr:unnamed protein product [Closterium sp. Yama58-4]